MDPSLIVAALAFLAIGGAGLAFAGGGVAGPNKKRIKAAGGGASPRRREVVDTAALKRRATTQEALKQLAQSEKQSRKARVSIKGQLAQAGINVSLTVYWVAAAVLGAALAVAGLMLQGAIGAGAGALIGALGLPRWILGMLVGMRQKKFTEQLADSLDVIVRGVKSGLPLNQCLRIIADESPEPIRSEFKNVVDGQAMGVPLDQNLARLYERMPLAEVNFLVIVLVIQQRTGGNLSESLGNLSAVLRSRKLMREKVKALSSEAKASAMIIGSLPFIVMLIVYIIKPDYMTLLFTTTTGNLILLGAAFMMTTGIVVMRNMINFKF
jgi:tight adherence protein B